MDRYDAVKNILAQPSSHSVGVMKLINKYYPAFAKKIFDRNPLMEKMAMANFSSMDIMVYPICGHCETLAAYSAYVQNPDGTLGGICTCLKCGKDTVNPITFWDWCLMELKKKAPPDIGDELALAVDVFAERCMADAQRLYTKTAEREKNDDQIVWRG